jgi:hypothetical protein
MYRVSMLRAMPLLLYLHLTPLLLLTPLSLKKILRCKIQRNQMTAITVTMTLALILLSITMGLGIQSMIDQRRTIAALELELIQINERLEKLGAAVIYLPIANPCMQKTGISPASTTTK